MEKKFDFKLDADFFDTAQSESELLCTQSIDSELKVIDIKTDTVPEIKKGTKELDEIIEYACSKGASDIHLIVGSKPAIRAYKVMEDIQSKDVLTPETAEILAMSCLSDKNMKTLEECGETDFSFTVGELGRFRANVFKQKGNYSMALRRIPVSIPEFDDLQLPPVIKSFANQHKGLVLVTGATGSGKSTTLASLINVINSTKKHHIITIEDPIEYVHKHKMSKINQREVGSDTNTFASALRAALREDPDVILVGEMRDPETIGVALTAAETGHLVFSTLHTVGAAKTIDRIIDSFPPESQNQVRSQLATVLKGVISQELLPRIDKKGIIAACEIMIVNSAIQNLIREGKPHQINSIIQTNTDVGMQSLDMHLAQLVLRGIVSKDEALVKAQDEHMLIQLIEQG